MMFFIGSKLLATNVFLGILGQFPDVSPIFGDGIGRFFGHFNKKYPTLMAYNL